MGSYTKAIVLISAILGCISGVALLGCDPVVRHKMLTFFFDGVPPLGGEDVEILSTAEMENIMPAVESNVTPGGNRVVRRSSHHKPAKNCQRCHKQGTTWSRKQLFKPVPQLCYECHTNYAVAQSVIHGPVAVGACLFCHEPHQSDYPKLLKIDMPELCYQCHEKKGIAVVPAHQIEPIKRCTTCHDPHISSKKKLLKPYASHQVDTELD